MKSLQKVIQQNWDLLYRGKTIQYSLNEVEHPAERPDQYRRLVYAWPVGQSCDYAQSLCDGSRIHIQCKGHKIMIHRDRWDPEKDFASFVLHGFLETPIGLSLILTGAFAVGVQAYTKYQRTQNVSANIVC